MTQSLPGSVNIYGLKCDAPTCDYNDPTIKFEEYESYINTSCPKCGAVLLTEADYKTTLQIIKAVQFAESLGLNDSKLSQMLGVEDIPKEDGDYRVKVHLNGTGIPEFEISKVESEDC